MRCRQDVGTTGSHPRGVLGSIGFATGIVLAIVFGIRAARGRPTPRGWVAAVAALLFVSFVVAVGSQIEIISSLSSGPGTP